jgi:basic membrane lipoprotein Med (substrate-binding protein (PBP1-ABC) superfamily)
MLRSIRAAITGAIAIVITVVGVVAAQAENPTQVRIAGILSAGIENAWSASVLEAVERLRADAPHGVEIVFDYTENVYGDTALTVFKTYADAGYDILFGHASYADPIEALMGDYPDKLFVMVGSGNRVLGGNAYLTYMHLHEPGYLLGVLAGKMTESNTLGIVGLFPADDVNDQVNGFRAGALSVNPNVSVKLTFIESWYDPAKASEAANAQIAAGADYIFQLGESFETCKEREVYCFGNYVDSYQIAGSIVPTSSVVYWDPVLTYLIDEWWEHETEGKAYDAPDHAVWFSMAEGGGDIAPYHDYDAVITPEARQAVAEAREAIMSGALTVELDTSLPTSD